MPNNVITKVQVRYYKECGSGAPSQIGPEHNLAQLPSDDQGPFATSGGGTLWGLPSDADASVGDPAKSFTLTMPSYDPACGDYVPVGVEVRVASRDDIDLNQCCAQLLALKFADCFHRLSQIRVWNDGNADNQPRVPSVTLTGGCGGLADAYFSYLPTASNNCKYDVSVQVNWGTRNQNSTNIPDNFTVSANGTNVPRQTWNPGGVSTYATTGGAITANPGANPVTISLQWEDTDKNHWWPDAASPCSNKNGNPCKYSGTDGHRAFVGTKSTAGAVALVRTSFDRTLNGVLGAPFDNHRSGGSGFDCNNSNNCTVYPTVGTVSVLRTGVFTTLRLDDPQANQTLQCDPACPPGPGVQGLPVRLHAVVRREHVGLSVVDREPRSTAPTRPVVLAPARCRWARTRPATTGSAYSPLLACRPARSATTSPSRPTTATTSRTTRARSSAATTTVTTTTRTAGSSGAATRTTRVSSTSSSSPTSPARA